MKTVTTRRIIKPSGGTVQPPALGPLRATPVPAGEALEPRRTSLWSAWQERFATTEPEMAKLIAHEHDRLRHAPRTASPAEARRIHDALLTAWTDLEQTFEAASIGADQTQVGANRTILSLRAAEIRALIRCHLVPSDLSHTQARQAAEAVATFLAGRGQSTTQ